MSSHHFVKEQQEPALLILDTSATYESISPLLEWSPTVLVAEMAVDTVLSWGIKVDVILATFDYQKTNLHLLEEQYPVKFMAVQECRYLEEGLHYLVASKHSAVNIIGYDHLKVLELEQFLDLIDLVVIDGTMRYFPVKQRGFRKWYAGVSLHLLAPEGTLVEITSDERIQHIYITRDTFVRAHGQVSFLAENMFWIGEMMTDN
ncbi:hypothetical protein [Anditalea andensis]|uniref:Thiamine pyrophosphokinase n=1 Tax=Anditalea andensis TaxID=1048983 RepID=A0A074KTR3_9BACT|nr:hypothetical protein [Anditalea andensis]KEO73366.1 thiamine pyrophosphokinase [Anditalea andensis]